MPRQGQNPLKWVSDLGRSKDTTLATIVCVPETSGYWENSLDILSTCLDSASRTTEVPHNVAVFDNGSCAEVGDWLIQRARAGSIDYLLSSSRNLGKVGAWNALFASIPGQWIAYTDSDVLFLEGWLESALTILEAFPEAGMVTCQPIAGDLSQHCDATLIGVASDDSVNSVQAEDLIPAHLVRSQRLAIGAEPTIPDTVGRRDILIERGGIQAFVSASHFQFVAPSNVLRRVTPLASSRPLGDDVVLDERLDSLGYWRLSCPEYLVHHLGNHFPDLGEELPWLEESPALEVEPSSRPRPVGGPSEIRQRLTEARISRRILKTLNAWTYKALYPRS